MSSLPLNDLRRRSVHLRGLADLVLMRCEDGAGAGGRIVQARTPAGLCVDIALDRGGDIQRLNWRGHELGWHSAAGTPAPWPHTDSEDGLGFLRGFDGFLVTCGLDHHGVATTTPADAFNYRLRSVNHHPLHGRIMMQRAELLSKQIDWEAGFAKVALRVTQASVFGEVLTLERTYEISLNTPQIVMRDVVTNRGFRPTRHGILYHVNFGYPMLDEGARLTGDGWDMARRPDMVMDGPSDDHVEIVDSAPSPNSGVVGITNQTLGVSVRIRFDPNQLPVTAVWRAFQSGVYALGIEPQTAFDADPNNDRLEAGERRTYGLTIDIEQP